MMTQNVFLSLHKNSVSIQRLIAALVFAVVSVTLPACSSDNDTVDTTSSELDSSMLDANTATVVYRFVDSSVPPQFHRSFSITSDANTSRFTIDSYGDILDDASMATDFDALSLVLTRLEQSNLPAEIGFSDSDGACAGGVSAFFSLYQLSDLETVVRSIAVYQCSSAEAELAMPELRNIIDPVLEPFDVDTRINNTRQ